MVKERHHLVSTEMQAMCDTMCSRRLWLLLPHLPMTTPIATSYATGTER